MKTSVNSHKLNGQFIPSCLTTIERPPVQLFYKGASIDSWLNSVKVAIVGSRKITSYGAYATELFAKDLASRGIVIISGLAYGVDAAAHRAALEVGGTSVAVLPTALDNIYPSAHLNLAGQLTKQGGLLSEYAPGDAVYKVNFTDRNRLIAGLCDALLITEAALKSGSLHTARYALNQGKTVMAVPGNINSPGSEGCNNLIKSGALPVTSPADIYAALSLKVTKRPRRRFSGSPAEKKVYNLIADGTSDQDSIALKLGIPASQLAGILTGLEINGYIRPLGAGNWSIA